MPTSLGYGVMIAAAVWLIFNVSVLYWAFVVMGRVDDLRERQERSQNSIDKGIDSMEYTRLRMETYLARQQHPKTGPKTTESAGERFRRYMEDDDGGGSPAKLK